MLTIDQTTAKNIVEHILKNSTMDIPDLRRQLTPCNLVWLQRNLGIRNSNHEDYETTMECIRDLLPLMEY